MEYKLKKLLKLIKNNRTHIEISCRMKISPNELNDLLNGLRRYGVQLQTCYYNNADIMYEERTKTSKEDENTELLLGTKNEITMMAISDQHYGNAKEALDASNKIYEYCTKNNIHIILNGGDLVDGISEKSMHQTIEEQVLYALEKYPYDRSIINFICFGNHDYDAKEDCPNYVEKIIKKNRHDIISLGYGMGALKIKNDNILLSHKIGNSMKAIMLNSNSLHLLGHSHRFKLTPLESKLMVHLPTLSFMSTSNSLMEPSALKLHIIFDENSGTIEQVTIDHLVVSDKIYTIFTETFPIRNNQKEKINRMKRKLQTPKLYLPYYTR